MLADSPECHIFLTQHLRTINRDLNLQLVLRSFDPATFWSQGSPHLLRERIKRANDVARCISKSCGTDLARTCPIKNVLD
jgi:hypothetical protein